MTQILNAKLAARLSPFSFECMIFFFFFTVICYSFNVFMDYYDIKLISFGLILFEKVITEIRTYCDWRRNVCQPS